MAHGETRGAPFADQTWPTTRTWSFFELLEQFGLSPLGEEIVTTTRQLTLSAALADSPIIAVCGMLNAGKSSTTAKNLSPAGRARTPIGLHSRNGTQRFVLWLPEQWKADAVLWGEMTDYFLEVFPGGLEALSDDPVVAHAQYRNDHTEDDLFGVLMIATDPNLNALGIAILDCPDIQRPTTGPRRDAVPVQTLRREMLGQAAQLCSYFLIVATMENIDDETIVQILNEISTRAKDIQRALLINKIRPRDFRPHEVLQQRVKDIQRDFQIEAVYGAWDFDISQSADFIPPPHRDAEFPTFFALSETPADNPPAADITDRLLEVRLQNLSTQRLHTDRKETTRQNLRASIRQALVAIDQTKAQQTRETADLQDRLYRVCNEIFIDNTDQMRITLAAEVVDGLLESLQSKAPGYVRPFMWANAQLHKLYQSARRSLRSAVDYFRVDEFRDDMLRSGRGKRLTATSLARMLKAEGIFLDRAPEATGDRLEQISADVISRFSQEHRSRLAPEDLDQMADRVWASVTRTQKAAAAVALVGSLVIGLFAVATIPIDLGTNVIFAASIKEILAVTALSTVFGQIGDEYLSRILRQKVALPAFADMLALLCDALMLPRERADGAAFMVQGEPLPAPVVVAPILDLANAPGGRRAPVIRYRREGAPTSWVDAIEAEVRAQAGGTR
ncbi:MAG: hypothetical protein AAFV53_16405 [Myxococcota bacterium]